MSQMPPAVPPPLPKTQRPGGLTALAVLNFVFGIVGAIANVATAVFGKIVLDHIADSNARLSEQQVQAIRRARHVLQYVWLTLPLALVVSVLLIVSAVGYLQMKKMGRTVGTAYAILALLNVVLTLTLVGTGFSLSMLIGLVYPVLTLILLNTTYKNVLVK